LIDTNDEVFASEVDLIDKTSNKGWVIAFDIKLQEVEV